MSNKQKIVLYTVGFPISCCSTVMLFLDNKLFERKTCRLENLAVLPLFNPVPGRSWRCFCS